MEIGSSCEYPYSHDETEDKDKVYTRVRVSVLRWARKNKRKFTTEKTNSGILIKRIE